MNPENKASFDLIAKEIQKLAVKHSQGFTKRDVDSIANFKRTIEKHEPKRA